MKKRILLIVLLVGCGFDTFPQVKIVKPKQAGKTVTTKVGNGQSKQTKTAMPVQVQTKTTSKRPQDKVVTAKTIQDDHEEVNHCPTGAGYVFSVLREGCVHLFDQSIQLLPFS